MRKVGRWGCIGLLFLLMLGTVGCHYTYPSAKVPDLIDAPDEERIDPKAPEFEGWFSTALEGSQEASRFWYSGWVASYVGRRQINLMVDGIVMRPEGYVANTRIGGNALKMIRWNEEKFRDERGRWYHDGFAQDELAPFGSFDRWTALTPHLTRAATGNVLGVASWVYEFSVPFVKWQALFPEAAVQDPNALPPYGIDDGSVTVTMWLAQEEPVVQQFEVDYEVPLPAAGMLRQEIFFRFYRYGDPGMEPVDVEAIRNYLLEEAD